MNNHGRSMFQLLPRGPYSLASSANFLCGFTPATGSSGKLEDGRLVLGFLDDDRHVPVTVALAQEAPDEPVIVEVARSSHVAEPAPPIEVVNRISEQVARILSLDHDARGLATVAAREPALRRLLEAAPGFRPVCFPSPYEAAVWGVLAQRVAMPVAAAIKQRLAVATGTVARGFGRAFHPSPAPERVLALNAFPGLPAEKLARLHAVALAALEGKLGAARLRGMKREEALDELRAIRGVGPWTAELILMRGSGVADELPTSEPRVLRAVAEAYGMARPPSAAEALGIAEAWRPYRMWMAVLLVMNLRGTARWSGRRRPASAAA